jgi:L-2,4-diaminobutyrate decarboxylase
LDQAYAPEAFRAAGHALVDRLADYLSAARAGEMPVLDSVEPGRLLEQLPAEFTARPSATLVEALDPLLRHSNHLHHPGYVGHQVSAPLPQAALVEAVCALLNNGMAVYEMGQPQTIMERHVLRFLGGKLGFGDDADGVLTHGGSLGNLTALLAARQAKAGHDVWTQGTAEPLGVLVSAQAHYCVARAVQCMGWGAKGGLGRKAVEVALADARARGIRVIAIIASCCSTSTGSFDPLPELADLAEEQDLWLHVDGAHGASLALSPRYRERLAGVERADSVVWDLHKLMGLPALNTAVLFREGRRAYEAFAQEASYLFGSADPREDWHDVGRRTLECTKRAMGAAAYVALQVHGTDLFAENVERLMGLAEDLAARIEAAPDFDRAHAPQANILCFRHRPEGLGEGPELDAHQERLRKQVLASGRFYLVKTRLRDRTWLRVTLMNPATRPEDLEDLLEALRQA